MYLRAELQEKIQPQSHYFTHGDSHKRFNPAGPQHAQVAACQGVLDYFAAVHRHHGGSESTSLTAMMQSVHALTAAYEAELAAPLIDYLAQAPQARLLGKAHNRDGDRAATIAFQPLGKSAGDVATALQAAGIGAERGHFYAHRLMTALGIDPADGVVRISLVHYNSTAEVDRILLALEQALR